MPTSTEWHPPEFLFEHLGVRIYATYKDDDIANGPHTYHYTADEFSDDNSFDVRELDVPSKAILAGCPPFMSESYETWKSASPSERDLIKAAWDAWHQTGEMDAIKSVIKDAISAGLVKAPLNESQN